MYYCFAWLPLLFSFVKYTLERPVIFNVGAVNAQMGGVSIQAVSGMLF